VLHYILGALILLFCIYNSAEETATGRKRLSKPPTFFDPALKPQLSQLEVPQLSQQEDQIMATYVANVSSRLFTYAFALRC
jgi:hypothetical protein